MQNNQTQQGQNITDRTRVNGAIRIKEVRVISDDGKQLGILPTYEAIKIAQDKGLDLVEVQPNQKPPVCKIMDYGKYKYQQKRKLAEQKKNQKVIEIKEMKFRPAIEEHDFNTKINHIKSFLDEGNKCRVFIMFKGREISHADLGVELMNKIIEATKDVAIVESPAKMENKDLIMLLAPGKGK